MKYRKKPVIVEATQWFANGTLKDVSEYTNPRLSGDECDDCGNIMAKHGWVATLEDEDEDGHIVCPGDWIITGVEGEKYPCKNRIFEMTYEAVE